MTLRDFLIEAVEPLRVFVDSVAYLIRNEHNEQIVESTEEPLWGYSSEEWDEGHVR